MFLGEGVERLQFDHFRSPAAAGGTPLLSLSNVQAVEARDSDFAVVAPRATGLRTAGEGAAGALKAGRPFSAIVSVENGPQAGLGKIILTLAGHQVVQWVWLQGNEKKKVSFDRLTLASIGRHELVAGEFRQVVTVEP